VLPASCEDVSPPRLSAALGLCLRSVEKVMLGEPAHLWYSSSAFVALVKLSELFTKAARNDPRPFVFSAWRRSGGNR